MEKYTEMINNEYIIKKENLDICEEGYKGIAASRLAAFENMVIDLTNEQIALSKKIQEYKLEGKAKTYQCRELMAKKLMNTTILSHLKMLRIIE